MVTRWMDFCCLGPLGIVRIDFCVTFWCDPGVICVTKEIHEINPSPPWLVGFFPTWPTFVSAAILNS